MQHLANLSGQPSVRVGAATTVQRKGQGDEDFGAAYKIIPISSNHRPSWRLPPSTILLVRLDEEVLNKISCFLANGSKEELVDVQHTLPDLTSFQVSFRSLSEILESSLLSRISVQPNGAE
jgi:hypothetical protein